MIKLLSDLKDESDPWLRRNFIANVIDGTFFVFGMSVVSVQTVLPVFVQSMGGNNIAVGLVPVIWTFGTTFPQIFTARFSHSRPYKRPLFVRFAFAQRLLWLVLALYCFFLLEHLGTQMRLATFSFLFLLTALGISINGPLWFDLITKVTPVRLRGRLFASRSLLGSMMGVLGGSVVAATLDSVPYPMNFGFLFLIAFVLQMISFGGLVRIREIRPSAVVDPDKTTSFSQVRSIMRADANFRNFVIADALIIASTMASAFYTVHAIQTFGLPEAFAGLFTSVMMATTIAGSIILGHVADRVGHRTNLVVSAGSIAVASVIALTAGSVEFYLIAFALVAVNISVSLISRYPIVAEFCPESQRATYIAIINTLTAPFILFGLAAGWMADAVGFVPVFVTAGTMAIAGLLWLLLKVKEPRHLPPFSVPEQG